MRIGRPIPPLMLTEDERATLERWARRPTTAQALAQRAQIILGCAADELNPPRGATAAADQVDGMEMAPSLSREAGGRPAR